MKLKIKNQDSGREKAIKNGGVILWDEGVAAHYEGVIQAAAKYYNFPFDTSLPIQNYTKEQKNFLLYGITFPDFVTTSLSDLCSTSWYFFCNF